MCVSAKAGFLLLALAPIVAWAEDVIRFGDPDEPSPPEEDVEEEPVTPSPWDFTLRHGLVEAGRFTDGSRSLDATGHARGIVRAERDPGEAWAIRLGARVTGFAQGGNRDAGYSRVNEADLDYDENWIRYRAQQWQLTLGAQKVFWGRVDGRPPTDRLGTEDLTRFVLDEPEERRRASPAVRVERFHGPWKVDVVALAGFRPAELPDQDSIWYPVDRASGRIVGLDTDTRLPDTDIALNTLVTPETDIDDDRSGSGGGGFRLGREGRDVDFAVTVQRARHSEPYFRASKADLERIADFQEDPPPAVASPIERLVAEHPFTWVLGGDVAFGAGAWTWRAEAAWLSDAPVTREQTWEYDTTEGAEWAIGAEGYPGWRDDLRLTLQLNGEHLLNNEDFLDPADTVSISGEVEDDSLLRHQLRARLRFYAALNRNDTYLNPELAWTAFEPHELFIGGHWMDGDTDTAGGFYQDRRFVAVGWRGDW